MKNLKGKRILITRPKGQGGELIAKLRRAGAKVIHIPLIEIANPSDNFRSLDRAISRLDKYDWLIFTSQNAVEKFFKRLSLRGARRATWQSRDVTFAAVGPSTAAALKQHGIKKIIIPKKGDYSSAGLTKVLKRYNFKGVRVLFPSAKKAKETLPAWLKKEGAKLDKVQAYQTVMSRNIDRVRLRKLVGEGKIDKVLFFSESAKRNFRKIVSRVTRPRRG